MLTFQALMIGGGRGLKQWRRCVKGARLFCRRRLTSPAAPRLHLLSERVHFVPFHFLCSPLTASRMRSQKKMMKSQDVYCSWADTLLELPRARSAWTPHPPLTNTHPVEASAPEAWNEKPIKSDILRVPPLHHRGCSALSWHFHGNMDPAKVSQFFFFTPRIRPVTAIESGMCRSLRCGIAPCWWSQTD